MVDGGHQTDRLTAKSQVSTAMSDYLKMIDHLSNATTWYKRQLIQLITAWDYFGGNQYSLPAER